MPGERPLSAWFLAMILAASPSTLARDLIREMGEPVELNARNEADLGGFVLRADDSRKVLRVELWIASTEVPSGSEDMSARFEKIEQGLQDPSVGGMFESAGGRFVWDRKRKAYYLIREISVGSLEADAVRVQVARFMGAGLMWREVWFARVCRIVYGTETPPPVRVTLPRDLLGGAPSPQDAGPASDFR